MENNEYDLASFFQSNGDELTGTQECNDTKRYERETYFPFESVIDCKRKTGNHSAFWKTRQSNITG